MRLFVTLERGPDKVSGVFFNGVKTSLQCMQKTIIVCNALKDLDLFAADRTAIISALVRNVPGSCACASPRFFSSEAKYEEVERYCKRNNINIEGNDNYVPIANESLKILEKNADRMISILLPCTETDKSSITTLQFFKVDQGCYEHKKPWEVPYDKNTGLSVAAQAYKHIIPYHDEPFKEFPTPYGYTVEDFPKFVDAFPKDSHYFCIQDRDVYLTDFSKVRSVEEDYFV